MNILVLDTSTPRAVLAVSGDESALHFAATDPGVRHGRNLIPAIRDLLGEAGLSPRDLGLIAVGLGPGSYTGLRIGVTAAKTLAYTLKLPLVGFDSLEPIARNAPGVGNSRKSVVADAQRGDLYTADFARESGYGPLVRTSPTSIESASRWRGRLVDDTFVIGPGLERLSQPLPDRLRAAGPGSSSPEGQHLGSRSLVGTLEPGPGRGPVVPRANLSPSQRGGGAMGANGAVGERE